ncbi:MAG: hypothetical protein ABIT37_06130 [Luteolibacter sp.]
MNFPTTAITRRFSKPALGFRNSSLGRIILPVCAMASLAMAPVASAKAPNGVYKFTRASGELTSGGLSYNIPKAVLKEIGSVENGSVTIRNGTLALNRKASGHIALALSQFISEPVFTSVKGPTSITFVKSGSSFIAKNAKPVVVKFTADVEGDKLAGVFRAKYNAKVTDGKLVINVTFSGTMGFVGSVNQPDFEATAKIICTR